MITVNKLTKRFGEVTAVDDLSFEAPPGRVTGFLGPNGAGKSTTMRCIVALDHPDSGSALLDGARFGGQQFPLRTVGTLLDAGYVHPGRSGRDHLRFIAASNGIAGRRVDEALGQVGLSSVGDRRVRTYSLGMRQRLGLAAALIGDPENLILDEPANGLDPEGVRWIRDFLQDFASRGRTVLVSSHLLGEIALMADDVVVVGQGRLIDHCTVDEFVRKRTPKTVRVASPQLDELLAALRLTPAQVERDPQQPSAALIPGATAPEIGQAAARLGIELHELTTVTDSLEDVFLRVTEASQDYTTKDIAHEVD